MDPVEIITKANRIEDQILIGLVRVSRTAQTLTRLIDAAAQSATGDQEKAILNGLSEFGGKFLQIVGTR